MNPRLLVKNLADQSGCREVKAETKFSSANISLAILDENFFSRPCLRRLGTQRFSRIIFYS